MKSSTIVLFILLGTVLLCSAQNTFLLKDINPGSSDGISANLDGVISSFDGKLYFIGYKDQGFIEETSIWSTDGTSENTNLIFTDDEISFSLFGGNRVLAEQNSIIIHNNWDIAYSYDGTELKTLFNLGEEDESFDYIYPYDDGVFVFYNSNSNEPTPLYYTGPDGVKLYLGDYDDIKYSNHVVSRTNELWLYSSDNNPGSNRTIVSNKESLGTMYLEDYLAINDYGDYFDIESAFGIEDRLYVTYREVEGGTIKSSVTNLLTKQRKNLDLCCEFREVFRIGNFDIIQTARDLYSYNIVTSQITNISDKIVFASKIYKHKNMVYFVESENAFSNRFTIIQTDGTLSGTEELIAENTFDDELDLLSVGADIVIRMKDEMNDYFLNHINLNTREVSNMIGEELVFGNEFFGIVNGTFVFAKNTDQIGTELYYSDFPLDVDEDGFLSNVDCNDGDPNINPDAIEICNGIDDNCDGAIDEGLPLTDYYTDADGDGFGNPSSILSSCFQPEGTVLNNTDCNDDDVLIYPGSTEICNGIDDNCDGNIDEGFNTSPYYMDADGDGFGDVNNVVNDCIQPTGTVTNGEDCNDEDASINPNATEACNGIDDNCDGDIDEGLTFTTYYTDADMDGYGDAAISFFECTQPAGTVTNDLDCDDTDPGINPDAEDIVNNGIDEDCDGIDATSSSKEIDGKLVKVYPSPVSNVLTIHSDYNFEKYLIYDIAGKLVAKNRMTSKIYVSNLKTGLYHLTLVGKEKSVLLKFLKE